jgi:hypothetical protein
MMAALDGELSAAERTELDRSLARDPELKREWERLRRVKEVTDTMKLRRPPEEVWGTYWQSVYNRLERGFGWILVSVGTIVLLAFGLWEGVGALLDDAQLPAFVKVAIFAASFGLVVLLFSVIREKLFVRRRDPYREIER